MQLLRQTFKPKIKQHERIIVLFPENMQNVNFKLCDGVEYQHYFFAVSELKGANGKLSTCLPHNKKPILYRWWFPREVALELLSKHKAARMLESTLSTNIYKRRYYALYLGKGTNGRTRFANHIHKHKRFSTLRRTIGGLLCTADEYEISKILDNCYYEWCEISCQQCKLEDLEKKAINKRFYPLNLKDNNNISEEWREKLEELRKKIS